MKRILSAFYAKPLSADLVEIQRALESKTLQPHLMDYGLSLENTMAKINGLSDEQAHRLAANIDALQAGSRVRVDNGTVIIILLLVLIRKLASGFPRALSL